MSKKDKRRATDNSRSFLTDDENISDSPFKNIVLKEKKEDEKKVKKTPPKKPSQIVQGYDPNASFKDILYNWEHTGNPYALPSKGKKEEIKAKETSFADIFAMWEKQNDGSKKRSKQEVKRVSPEYKPTKDFGSLLDQFEGNPQKKQSNNREVKIEKQIAIDKPTFFKQMEEDDERPSSVSWSVFGDNKPIIREEKKVELKQEAKETEVKRLSPEYKPTKDFGTLLNSFEGGIKPKKVEKEEIVKTEEKLPDKPTFFKEKDEDDERPSSVSWSIFGDNKPIIREEKKVEVKQEEIAPPIEPISIKKAPVKKSKLFNESVNKIPQKSFEEILKEKGEVKKKQREKTLNELRVMLPMATLDLHGMTYVEAENEINNFINEAISSKIQKIAIIHGKGLHSEDGVGVLKDLVYKILNDRNVAREITIPKPQYGGSGAVWVILKKEEEAQ